MAALSGAAIAGIVAAGAAGGLASGLGGALTGQDQADNYKKAAREYLAQMERMAQWGYGYPQWMLDDFKANVAKGGDYATELKKLYTQAAPLYNQGYGENPLTGPTNEYVQRLQNTPGSLGQYQNMARMIWNKAQRGQEAIPGQGQRAITSARQEMTNSMATAMQQAMVQSANERNQNSDKIYGAESDLGKAKIQQMIQELAMKQQYAQMGMALPGQQQQLEMSPLTAASQLQNRSPGAVWPGMDAPGGWSTIMNTLGSTINGGLNAFGMAKGLGGLGGGGGQQTTQGSNPYGQPYQGNYAPGAQSPYQAPAAQQWGSQMQQQYGGPITYNPYAGQNMNNSLYNSPMYGR